MLLAYQAVHTGGIRTGLMGTNNTFPIGLEAYFIGRNLSGNISKGKHQWRERSRL